MSSSGTAPEGVWRWLPGWARQWAIERLPRVLPGGEPERPPITLDRRRIYILPTRAGWFFGILLTVMLLGALNYNNNLALLLTFLLGGVMLIAPVHTHRNVAGLVVTGCHADPVFAGQRARFRVHLAETAGRARCAVRAQTLNDSGRMDVDGDGHATLELTQPAPDRGWMAANRIRVFTEYPLGLFHAWSWLDSPGAALVYPTPEANPPPLPFGDTGSGDKLQRDSEEEFAGLRDYRAGDPSRLIAWKALARTERLMSKAFLSPRQRRVRLDYGTLHGLRPEQRLSRLTAWVLEAHRQQVAYGLVLPGRELPPARSDTHRLRCLEALALAKTA